MLDVPCVRLRVADITTPRSLTPFAYLYIELLCLAIGAVFLCFCGVIKSAGLPYSSVRVRRKATISSTWASPRPRFPTAGLRFSATSGVKALRSFMNETISLRVAK